MKNIFNLLYLYVLFINILHQCACDGNIDVGISVLKSESDEDQSVLRFDVGTHSEPLPPDLSVRIYHGVYRIFESSLNDSMSEFVMDAKLLEPGENILDVTFFSSEYGTVFAKTKLHVYRGSQNPTFGEESLTETNSPKPWGVSKYLAFAFTLFGYSGLLSMIALKVGPLIYNLLQVGEPPIMPIFEPIAQNFPLLPSTVPMQQASSEIIRQAATATATAASPSVSRSILYAPIMLTQFVFRWGPRIAVLFWSGKAGWARFIAHKLANAPVTPAQYQAIAVAVQPAAKNIFRVILPKVWRSAVVVVGTVGLKLFALLTKRGTGRIFHQHIGVHDLQRLF
eukprot:gene6583-13317_t